MIISKHIESKIEQDYFFIKGTIPDINHQYFIDKINEGIKEKNNKNFKTNVQGFMTDWGFFNNDPIFVKILFKLIQYTENNCLLKNKFFSLKTSWGIKEIFGGYTKEHNHHPALWSGVIYLSNVDQKLVFPQIKQEINVQIGNFGIFSSFLNHKTENRIDTETEKNAISFDFNVIES